MEGACVAMPCLVAVAGRGPAGFGWVGDACVVEAFGPGADGVPGFGPASTDAPDGGVGGVGDGAGLAGGFCRPLPAVGPAAAGAGGTDDGTPLAEAGPEAGPEAGAEADCGVVGMARVVAVEDAPVPEDLDDREPDGPAATVTSSAPAAGLVAGGPGLGAADEELPGATVGRSASWVPVPDRSPALPVEPGRATWSG